MDKFITVKVIEDGSVISVKQSSPGSEYFLTSDNDAYKINELDFNVEQDSSEEIEESFPITISKMYATEVTNEKVKLRAMEKDFWRNMRGTIFVNSAANHPVDKCLEVTEYIVNQLKEQDIRFNKKYEGL